MHNPVFPLFLVVLLVVFFFSLLAIAISDKSRKADNVCAIQGKQTYIYHGYEYPCPQQDTAR